MMDACMAALSGSCDTFHQAPHVADCAAPRRGCAVLPTPYAKTWSDTVSSQQLLDLRHLVWHIAWCLIVDVHCCARACMHT